MLSGSEIFFHLQFSFVRSSLRPLVRIYKGLPCLRQSHVLQKIDRYAYGQNSWLSYRSISWLIGAACCYNIAVLLHMWFLCLWFSEFKSLPRIANWNINMRRNSCSVISLKHQTFVKQIAARMRASLFQIIKYPSKLILRIYLNLSTELII